MKQRSIFFIRNNAGLLFLIPFLIISTTGLRAQYQFQAFSYDQNGVSVIQNQQGDFVAACSQPDGSGGNDGNIIVISPTGAKKWNNRYHRASGQLDKFSTIVQLPDKGYMVLATNDVVSASKYRPTLMRTDSLGNEVFVKSYGDFSFSNSINGNSMVLLSNNKHLLIAGEKFRDGYLLKTDLSGNPVWGKVFDIPYTLVFNSVRESKDGKSYFIAGTITSSKIFFIKTDTAGTVQWKHEYSMAKPCKMYSFLETNDGGFLLVANYDEGSNAAKALVIKTDNSGIVQWHKAYYSQGKIQRAQGVCSTHDNGFVISGWNQPAVSGTGDASAFKINASGVVVWSKGYNYLTGTGASMNSVTMAKDKGFFMAGQRGLSFYAIKTDSLGISFCNDKDVALKDTSFSVKDTSYTINITLDKDTFSTYLTLFVDGGVYNIECSTVSIVERGSQEEIKIYPNPGNGIVNIRINEDLQGRPLEIEIYDMTGKRLYKGGIKPDVPTIKTLDLSGYAKGIYFLRLVVKGETLRTGKIAVH